VALLETQGITKKFGGLTAVDNISLKLGDAELRCIIGPNGCGKTTFFNLITGHYKPTQGRIRFCGRDITGQPVHRISRLGIGRKFQVPGVFDELTVYENIRVPFFSGQRQPMFVRSRLDSAAHEKIMDSLSGIDLASKAGELARNLSHGERQWLEIGMVLASHPRLMLLDEPTAGMTVSETRKTVRLIRGISAQTGISILVIEHDIGFIREIGGHITVMYKGSVFRQGSYQQIQDDPAVREIYLGRGR
jgi:urea ABC transporter ATP-binding protein UrtD